MKKLNVAIIGQGRSGRNIHGRFFKSTDNELYNVVAVCDEIELRRQRAAEEYPGCAVYSDYRELFGRNDIDLVINSTFSYLHCPITVDLLEHGFNVLVEKPMAHSVAECDKMIEASKKSGKLLAIFQQSRFAPYYEKIKELLASGDLGKPLEISIYFSGFSRRWDWQCSNRFYGGNLLNTGPHPVDQALDLLGFDENISVFSRASHNIISGDAEDYVKLILTAPNKPLIDIEISNCDPYSPYLYRVQCTKGALRADMKHVEWKYFIPEHEPSRELVLKPLCDDNGYPCYCSEKLTWHEFNYETVGTSFDVAVRKYYEMLYASLTENKPLVVTPEQVRAQIKVAEEVHSQNPLPVLF